MNNESAVTLDDYLEAESEGEALSDMEYLDRLEKEVQKELDRPYYDRNYNLKENNTL